MTKPWSLNEIAALQRMKARGLSFQQMANALPGRTRSAVAGKIHGTGDRKRLEMKQLQTHISLGGPPWSWPAT